MSFPPPPHHLSGLPPLPPSMVPPAFHFPPMATMMPMGLMSRPMLPPGMPTAQLTDNRMMNPRGHMPRKPIIPRRMDEINRVQINQGPTITVFVGNITERAADNLVKQLLMKCGNMVSWKRVQGASGKLQAFGFCEYGDPESALRAIRILHEWELGDKKLVVKVDAKTKEQLDEYKANKRRTRFDIDSAGSKTPTESERDDEDELDEETKKDDSIVRTGIQVLLKDYEYELSRSMLPSEMRKKARQERAEEDKEAKDNLDEMDLEEDKKNLIHREIDKFRDTMKKLEEEKEKEKERREKERERRDRERERDHHRRERNDGIGSGSMSNRLHGRSPERAGARSRDHLVNNRSRSRSREREREREHERSREKERERENFITIRDKEIDRDKREKDKEREREEEEEAYERRKLERKIREKDATYQERLRNWEARERKKAREYEKYKEKEEEKRSEEMKEARRLKEFLEDYDDERDDPKYYKSNALLRRMKDREKEIENDNRDRQKEKEELEELRLKLLEEGHPDPNAELERIKKETEEKFKPLVKSEVIKEEPVNAPAHITLIDISESKSQRKRDEDKRPSSGASMTNNPAPAPKDHKSQSLGFSSLKLNETNNAPPSNKAPPAKEEEAKKPKLIGFSGLKLGASPVHPQSGPSSAAIAAANRKKKLTVGEVFNMDEDESSDGQPKKRKLVPLDYTEDEKKAVNQTGSGSTSQEEKRKHIKNLIDKIPTEKDKLFEYVIDWSIVDNVLMERRIRPWINKKIVEYIGEEEPTLVDFICSKLMVGSAPQSILDDVQMVLDDEAEVFVVKMWRLLIYEIEAKKLGLVK